MRRVSFRAVTAILLTAVGLMASACTVYDESPRYHHGYSWHDRHDWR